jgi:hypothetical protein
MGALLRNERKWAASTSVLPSATMPTIVASARELPISYCLDSLRENGSSRNDGEGVHDSSRSCRFYETPLAAGAL